MLLFFIKLMYNFVYGYYIESIQKESLFGNIQDKTLEYYTNKLFISPIDTEYLIDYTINNNNYKISIPSEKLNSIISYIHCRDKNIYTENNILACYEFKDDTYNDITDIMHSYSGPSGDFYQEAEIVIKRCHISKYPIRVIDKNFKIYCFIDEDAHIYLDSKE